MDKRMLALAGGLTAILVYQNHKIRRLRHSIVLTNESMIEHLDAHYQEIVDEEFDDIIEELDI